MIRADYNSATWTLTIGFPGITKQEIDELQTGDVRFTFTLENGTVFLLFKIGAFDWMNASFAPGLNEQIYHKFPDGKGAPLTIFIVDTSCGKLEGIRVLGMGTKLSNKLNETCEELSAEGSITPEENERRVRGVYAENSTKDLLEAVDIRDIFILMRM